MTYTLTTKYGNMSTFLLFIKFFLASLIKTLLKSNQISSFLIFFFFTFFLVEISPVKEKKKKRKKIASP
jgi:hypothetical protein